MEPVPDVSRLLASAHSGDATALERLYDEVYAELHRLARARLAEERVGHTLQPTALVHEVFVRLLGADARWDSSGHFFGAAGRAMRQILVDHARRRGAKKRGGERQRVSLSGLEPSDGSAGASLQQVLEIDDALTRLEAQHPRKARVVELRFFAGLSMQEIAASLDVSRQTAQLDWEFARAWLHRELAQP